MDAQVDAVDQRNTENSKVKPMCYKLRQKSEGVRILLSEFCAH